DCRAGGGGTTVEGRVGGRPGPGVGGGLGERDLHVVGVAQRVEDLGRHREAVADSRGGRQVHAQADARGGRGAAGEVGDVHGFEAGEGAGAWRRRAVAQVYALQVIAGGVHQVAVLVRIERAGAGEVKVVAEAGVRRLV